MQRQRAALAEALVELVPVPHVRLAALPAQVDDLPVHLAVEVDGGVFVVAERATQGLDLLDQALEAVQAAFDGCWVVDHLIADEAAGEAVIEWTLFWTPPDTGVRVATRGAEWYVFEGGLIKEIRAYYRQDPAQTSELEGFPYAERGYSLPGAERSAVQPQPR